jgi:GntR family transcriptional regulator/MocR family aminotransferase
MLPIRETGVPAYRWLYESLRKEILEGRLRPGARLPGTRDLGEQYGLSRGTIVSAFDQLKSEGYVDGSVGSGTYVSSVLPDELLHVPRRSVRVQTGTSSERARPRPRRLSAFARRVRPFPVLADRPMRAFRSHVPALDLFPTTLWAQLTARRLRRATVSMLYGCNELGYAPLREAIADYLTTSRGVTCTPEQVMIVSGAQEALDLITRLTVDPGDRVCIEDPGYRGAALAFEAAGAKISPLPLDDQGAVLRASRLRGARLVYITPAHQYPTGVAMSLARRLELLEWARNAGALLFEDDYDSEFRYSGRPIPALQSLDHHGVVVFAGSFNKVLFPSLRLGYVVVPHDLVAQAAAVRSITARHPPLLDQAVVCDFITAGHFGRHLRRMREIYAERLSILVACAKERLDGLLELSNVEAGLQTAGWLREGVDAQAVTEAAAKRDLEIAPLSYYSRTPMKRDGLQLGFAAVDGREIRRGVRELGVVLEAAVALSSKL